MPKVPWMSPVLLYELDRGHYVARSAFECVLVRDVASCPAGLLSCNESLRCKLLSCPFMVVCADGACVGYSAVGELRPWDADEHSLVPTILNAEDDVVYVNHPTHLTSYVSNGAQYELLHAEQLLCTTVCMPRTFPEESLERVARALQKGREVVVARQCSRALVVLADGNGFHYGADFNTLKELRTP